MWNFQAKGWGRSQRPSPTLTRYRESCIAGRLSIGRRACESCSKTEDATSQPRL